MSDIKWIKLTTDMFDNRKIKQIRHLPEGNNIVLIWVMLLTIAGRCNACGMIFLTENIPYTLESLSVELEFDVTVVQLALKVLTDLGMIVMDKTEFRIANWEEYQNIEGMEKIKEQTKERVARYRQRQKQIGNVTRNVTVTQSNATDIDIEEDIKKENKNKSVLEEFAAGDSELLDALNEFKKFRRLQKKPLTDNAQKRLCKKLEAFKREDWVAILYQSIDQGWSGIYELKGDGNVKSVSGNGTPHSGKFDFLPDL